MSSYKSLNTYQLPSRRQTAKSQTNAALTTRALQKFKIVFKKHGDNFGGKIVDDKIMLFKRPSQTFSLKDC